MQNLENWSSVIAPPKVSVCIDSCNYARFLSQAIESVLDQTFTDFELIVVDDCSADDSFKIARGYAEKDSRVVARQNERNLGMVRNRNACLGLARGYYVKFVHADDFLCSPTALERMVAVLEGNPAISLVAAARKIVDADGRPRDTWSCFDETRPPLTGTTVITRCLREQRNLIGGPSAVMFRRDRAARGFDESFFVMADLEMWFHLLEQGCFAYLPEPLAAFRTHRYQQTAKDKRTLEPALENRALLAAYLDRPYVRIRRWIKEYLRYDAVRRIERRSNQLSASREMVEEVIREYGGHQKYLAESATNLCREQFLKIGRLFERHVQPQLRRVGALRAASSLPVGMNVVGFVKGEYGIGESSRALWRAVKASGLPCVLVNVHSRMHRNLDATFTDFSPHNPYRVNLMTFSFDYARRFYRDMGRRFVANRYNIGFWFWEQEQFPPQWHSAFDYYDEVWVPTRFIQRALAAVSPISIRKITYPLYVNDAEAIPDRASFGLSESSFVFLFSFDFLSTALRKNPLAVIEAFRRAFRPNEDVILVLKSINADHDRQSRELLTRRGEGLRVVFIDFHLAGSQVNALFASADCYVSLHRAEGLGLGIAQAMYLGKPVIGTGYSGNLEFMSRENSLLVDYQLTTVEQSAGAYEAGTVWADPDVNHAAELMRWVYLHREESAAIGSRAAQEIRRTLDPAQTQQEIFAIVRELTARGQDARPRFR